MSVLTAEDMKDAYFFLIKESNVYNNRDCVHSWYGPFADLGEAKKFKQRREKRCNAYYDGAVTCTRIRGWENFLKKAAAKNINPTVPVEFRDNW